MRVSELIESRLELLSIAMRLNDQEWIEELKGTLTKLVETKKFIELKKKEYGI